MVILMTMLVVKWVVLQRLWGVGIGQINDGGIRLLDWIVGKRVR